MGGAKSACVYEAHTGLLVAFMGKRSLGTAAVG